ncbi:SusC/RagA family TonB-linked outer membrane protein [Hymenobacter weizhouensis]|uniref:SusC/RagA family TonB-linked outer membrane protein n=1 Tax=Hymenobacter sp. YIM 151500-1 TaxID=2987689 RepID=UPI002225FA1F|nr:TonB-dependent receptor [Hymenobacter sp. YIM 151500-1]UYZ62398.1 TonB-dependent receptor [Hymenobacter sp. YIM 151500-1]
MSNFTLPQRWPLLLLGCVSGAAQAQTGLVAANQSYQPSSPRAHAAAKQPLESVLQNLKATHGVYFFYRSQVVEDKLVDANRPAFASFQEELSYVLAQANLQYEKTRDNVYVLTPRPAAEGAAPSAGLPAQTIAAVVDAPISGRVTDRATGQGIPGVTVLVKGTTTGVSTNADGTFSLTVPDNATLVFSGVGFVSQEVAVGSRTTIDISLSTDTKALSEVVVVGYGTQERRDLTGSVASVKGKDVANVPTPTFESALQGKMAGVQVTQGSGVAGSTAAVRIRGVGSLTAGGEPLYVVDGVPIVNEDNSARNFRTASVTNALATINPNDIESIDVLKDAAATAIYGSRGANGVIIITTKSGKLGKPQFRVGYQAGISNATVKTDLLNATEWIDLYNEAYRNDGGVGEAPLPRGLTRATAANTDWQDLTTRTGFQHQADVSFSQGTEKLKSYVGLSYNDQNSYLVGNSYERLSGRVNLDFTPTSRLSLGVRASFARGINDRVPSAWAGGWGWANGPALVIYPVRNPDGSYFFPTDFGPNPVAKQENFEYRTQELRTISNVYADYEIVKGLRARLEGGLDYLDQTEDLFVRGVLRGNGRNEAQYRKLWTPNVNINGTLTYARQLAEVHNVEVLVGTNYQRADTYSRGVYYDLGGLVEPLRKDDQLRDSLLTSSQLLREPLQAYSFTSYFSRLNYKLKDRYLVGVSVRVDGSSRFGRKYRYGTFPAFSAGWIVTEEPFLNGNNILSFLKLRASYGLTGNANIENYGQYGSFFPPSDSRNSANYNGELGLERRSFSNDQFRWENTAQTDVGFDFALFNNRVSGTFSAYYKKGTDLLIPIAQPISSGVGSVNLNIGEVENKGLEITLNSRNLVGDFAWNTDFNIAFNRNKVLDIGGLSPDVILTDNEVRTIVGYPISTYYLARYVGVDPQDGLPIYLDREGNQTKTYSTDLRVPRGSGAPDYTGGLTNTFTYKGFDLSALLSFSVGSEIYDDSRKRQEGTIGLDGGWNQRRKVLERWQRPGDITDVPKLTLNPSRGGYNPDTNSDRFLYDGSYLRLRQLTFGYTFTGGALQALRLKSARLYFLATNVFLVTGYDGDPEFYRDQYDAQGRNLIGGATYLFPPQARTFTMGFNIGF